MPLRLVRSPPLVLFSFSAFFTEIENDAKRRERNKEGTKPPVVEDVSEPAWERIAFHPESVTGKHLWNLSYPGWFVSTAINDEVESIASLTPLVKLQGEGSASLHLRLCGTNDAFLVVPVIPGGRSRIDRPLNPINLVTATAESERGVGVGLGGVLCAPLKEVVPVAVAESLTTPRQQQATEDDCR